MTIANVLDMITSDTHVEICKYDDGICYRLNIIDWDTPIDVYYNIRNKYKNTTCKWIRSDIANEITLIFDEYDK